ncbi:MAG: hypothetical protein BWZ10_02190 [candidate division BRC1 bacterium ADurb.BinA364]|nr:MAG: hypothetical protein BWZ10_02190 [candidate division BRC1 bacterium ADurb.BinA364]
MSDPKRQKINSHFSRSRSSNKARDCSYSWRILSPRVAPSAPTICMLCVSSKSSRAWRWPGRKRSPIRQGSSSRKSASAPSVARNRESPARGNARSGLCSIQEKRKIARKTPMSSPQLAVALQGAPKAKRAWVKSPAAFPAKSLARKSSIRQIAFLYEDTKAQGIKAREGVSLLICLAVRIQYGFISMMRHRLPVSFSTNLRAFA